MMLKLHIFILIRDFVGETFFVSGCLQVGFEDERVVER